MNEIYSTAFHHPSMLTLVTGLFCISVNYLFHSQNNFAKAFFSSHALFLLLTFIAYFCQQIQFVAVIYIALIAIWVSFILPFPKVSLGIKSSLNKKLNIQAIAIAVLAFTVTGIWQKL